uniref:Uncharacterized protein n=1 Tax=Plectus sambesii TaxID=2011161 RepID=A0A914VZA7_9BILA
MTIAPLFPSGSPSQTSNGCKDRSVGAVAPSQQSNFGSLLALSNSGHKAFGPSVPPRAHLPDISCEAVGWPSACSLSISRPLNDCPPDGGPSAV